MPPTDDTLIESYRNGDEAAFKFLIERYVSPIYIFSRRMSGSSEDASDISQETFVKVWKTLPRYKMTNTFKAWIFAIARNTAIDKLRKKRISVFSEFETSEGRNSVLDTLGDPETLPATLIQKAEDKKLLDGAFVILPLEDREILTLHYSDEMTFEAIGKLLNKPLNTVKSKHRRALAKLKNYFEKTDE
jgi:RNA polymerase sigma-70 factor (ECF subfamily)